ncbi:MAG: sugar-binding domain-containing protein, partial [Armatimonadota bacterium]
MEAVIRVLILVCATLVVALPSCVAGAWAPVKGRIATRWAKDVSPTNVHPEYPRPMMVRRDWQNLNGVWDFALSKKADPRPAHMDDKILVPFPAGSPLSGIGHLVRPNERIWYKRMFTVPKAWKGRRILLNFGAVDWESTVWVNGREVGTHKGGYDPFTFDITDALKPFGSQEIVLTAWDPTDQGGVVRGKQHLTPQSIFYTPSAGIWQTAWLEPVNAAHVASYKAVPDIDKQVLRITVDAPGATADARVEVIATDGKVVVSTATGAPGEEIVLPIRNPKLWSPTSPHLYGLRVSMISRGKKLDTFSSYLGMRKISVMKDDAGINRLALNNKVLFQFGPLDQGFWPDGVYLAPTDAALRYDLEAAKKFGANMIRKHIKVEPQRLYYWADKLGVMVWQDMPCGDDRPELRDQFDVELRAMVGNLYNHPSIVMWVLFNEAMGQHDTERLAEMVRKADPSRLIDNASGWSDKKVGDVTDSHIYPDPGVPALEPNRAAVLGEFGGVGGTYLDHYYTDRGNFAYVPVLDITAATDTYVAMLAKLPGLISKGLSAAVYTQLTDVEREVNGWMSYDRAVFKINSEVAGDMARRLYGPPLKTVVIVPCA